jgi:protein tyrosine phosphatase
MKTADFKDHLKKAKSAVSQLLFHNTFYEHFPPTRCQIALHQENLHKNVFPPFALPYDHNLIPNMKYINASPMSFAGIRYIASQGPLKQTLPEFWHMIWAQKINLILTVANPYEIIDGMRHEKFEKFWPEKGEVLQYKDFKVELLKKELRMEWVDGRREKIFWRLLQISHANAKREINHLYMENWPDDGLILPESLFHLKEEVERLRDDSPIVVHCAGGIGRTGTFIGAHSLYQEMKTLLSGSPNGVISFDIPKRIQEMRQMRYGTMVANPGQYLLLVDALELALNKHSKN